MSHWKVLSNCRSRLGRTPKSVRYQTSNGTRPSAASARQIGVWYWIGCVVTIASIDAARFQARGPPQARPLTPAIIPRKRGSRHRFLQVLVNLVEEAGGGEPLLLVADQQREVLGHETGLDGVDADLLQGGGELRQGGVVVELGAVREPTRPGEDRGDRVGRGLLALLMLAVVARHGAMRGFRLDDPAVRRHQHRGHQPERAEALRHDVGLHVAVVVLAGPEIAT